MIQYQLYARLEGLRELQELDNPQTTFIRFTEKAMSSTAAASAAATSDPTTGAAAPNKRKLGCV